MKEVGKLGFILFLICAVCSGLLALVNSVTAPVIAQQAELAKEEALKKLLTQAEAFVPVENIANDYIAELYIGYAGQEYVGCVAKTMPAGYGGTIELFVGVDTEGKITGIEVLSHSETPGLGANLKTEDFRKQFIGQKAPLEVVKGTAKEGEISAITGATITTKAVTGSVSEVVAYIVDNQETLMKEGK